MRAAIALLLIGVVSTALADVNAIDFGADPTGQRDSTAAIQKALDHHATAYLPRGTYQISSPLGIFTSKLRGDGTATVLVATKPMPAMIRNAYANLNALRVVTEVYIDGLTLNGNGKAMIGLDLTEIAYSRFDNVTVRGCLDAGILISDQSVSTSLFQNIIAKRNKDGVRVEHSGNAATIVHLTALDNTRNGLRIDGNGGLVESCRVIGGDIEGNGEAGIYVGAAWGVLISGVHLEGNQTTRKCFEIEASPNTNPTNTVLGCLIVLNGQDPWHGRHISGCDWTRQPLAVYALGTATPQVTYAD